MGAVAERCDASYSVGPRQQRPILLGTLAVCVHPAAEQMAIACALEAGAPLTVANAVVLPLCPMTMVLLGPRAATLPHEESLEAVRATAHRAAALGIPTRLLRISSPRPVRALLEVAEEEDAALFVFGADPKLLGGRRFRRAARSIREHAACLLWIVTQDGAGERLLPDRRGVAGVGPAAARPDDR